MTDVWGMDGKGDYGVFVRRMPQNDPEDKGREFAVGVMSRRKRNRKERRNGDTEDQVVTRGGAALTREDLTRLRATIDEELKEETHDGQETA